MASISLRVKAVSQRGLDVPMEFIPVPSLVLSPITQLRAHATLATSRATCCFPTSPSSLHPQPLYSCFFRLSGHFFSRHLHDFLPHLTCSSAKWGLPWPLHLVVCLFANYLHVPSLYYFFNLRNSTWHCLAYCTIYFTFLFIFSHYLNGKLQINWVFFKLLLFTFESQDLKQYI